MSSDAQISANRQNALQSTGPVTPDGKALVARNALRHGLTARSPLVANEDKQKYQELAQLLREQLRPEGPLELMTTERIIATAWRLRRTPGIERSLFHHLATSPARADSPPRYLGEAYALVVDGRNRTHLIEKLTRYEAHLHRQLRRDIQDLLALQSLRDKSAASRKTPSLNPANLELPIPQPAIVSPEEISQPQ